MKKQEVQQILDAMPDDIDPEEIHYRLYLKAKLERAEQEIAEGKGIPHEDVVRQSQQWQT